MRTSKSRHSFVAFFPSDWQGGVSGMPRLMESVYFRICMFTWDKVQPVSLATQAMMNADLGPGQGEAIIDALVDAEKLTRLDDGSVYSERAMREAQYAFDMWERKSSGGKKGAAAVNGKKPAAKPKASPAGEVQDSRQESSAEPSPDPDPDSEDSSGLRPSPDGAAQIAPDSNAKDAPPAGDGGEASGGVDKKPPVPEKVHKRTLTANEMIDAWNVMAEANGLATVKVRTAKRITAMGARIDECGADAVLEAIKAIPNRPFCMKPESRSWCTIDFLCRPNSVAKLIEGAAYQGGSDGGWANA